MGSSSRVSKRLRYRYRERSGAEVEGNAGGERGDKTKQTCALAQQVPDNRLPPVVPFSMESACKGRQMGPNACIAASAPIHAAPKNESAHQPPLSRFQGVQRCFSFFAFADCDPIRRAAARTELLGHDTTPPRTVSRGRKSEGFESAHDLDWTAPPRAPLSHVDPRAHWSQRARWRVTQVFLRQVATRKLPNEIE